MYKHMSPKEEDLRSDVILSARSVLFNLLVEYSQLDHSNNDEIVRFFKLSQKDIEDTLANAFDCGFEMGKIHERTDTKFYQNYNLSEKDL